MNNQDIRWIQRFKHLMQAFLQLEKAIHLANQRSLTELEGQGLIQSFEYTHELAWNVFKDFLEEQGIQNLYGSKDTTREAFRRGLIENGEIWMDMIKSRNLTSHTYHSELAQEIIKGIKESYFEELKRFIEKIKLLYNNQIS